MVEMEEFGVWKENKKEKGLTVAVRGLKGVRPLHGRESVDVNDAAGATLCDCEVEAVRRMWKSIERRTQEGKRCRDI